MDAPRLSRTEACRVAIRAQLLTKHRPTELLAVVHQLTLLQLDPTAAVAPNADLVAWTRLGGAYQPSHLTQALDNRALFELNAMVRPMNDLPLYRAEMAAWPQASKTRDWLQANQSFRQRVLDQIRGDGPLLSRDVPDSSEVSWPSSGWSNNRNVTQMLALLAARGEIAIAGRNGRQRRWDLSERIYPPDLPTIPAEDALRLRNERALRSLGIARASWVGVAGAPAEVQGTAGEWRVDPDAIGKPFAGRTALLSPFDRLVYDRARVLELFDFEYKLEMYVPTAKRRWGFFALPVLHGDRLIGKVDATADHKASVLRVNAIHEDVPFTAAMSAGVRDELDSLASWLALDAVFTA